LTLSRPNGKKATRPCRCGYLHDPARACARAPRCAAEYQAKLSGPLLDRIDLHVEVPEVPAGDLTLPPPAEGSPAVAARVAKAREVQTARYGANGPRTNAEADGELLMRVATPDGDGVSLLAQATERMKLSARGYHRVLRVARTLADLDGKEAVRRAHVAEALSYRRGSTTSGRTLRAGSPRHRAPALVQQPGQSRPLPVLDRRAAAIVRRLGLRGAGSG